MTLTYLNAAKAAGSTDPDEIMDELHKAKIDDMFTSDGVIREDGLLQHSTFVVQVKSSKESRGDWVYYKLVKTMPEDIAFGSIKDSVCPLIRK